MKYKVAFLTEIEATILIEAESSADAIRKIEAAEIDIELVNGTKKIGETTPTEASLNLKYISEVK